MESEVGCPGCNGRMEKGRIFVSPDIPLGTGKDGKPPVMRGLIPMILSEIFSLKPDDVDEYTPTVYWLGEAGNEAEPIIDARRGSAKGTRCRKCKKTIVHYVKGDMNAKPSICQSCGGELDGGFLYPYKGGPATTVYWRGKEAEKEEEVEVAKTKGTDPSKMDATALTKAARCEACKILTF